MGSRSTSRRPAAKESPKEEIEQARRCAEQMGMSLDEAVKEAPAKKEKLKKLDRRISAVSSRLAIEHSVEIH